MYYKYEVEKQQVSYDGGLTWTDTYVTRRSDNYVGVYNTLSECEGGEPPTPSEYLTIESLENNNTIYFMANNTAITKTISASTNDGATWTEYTSSTGGSGTTIATLNRGGKVLLKGENSRYSTSSTRYNQFKTTGQFEVRGNIMSLISGDSFSNANELTETYSFYNLFKTCSGLTSAENLLLPATTLSNNCYQQMFEDCTGLTVAPELPATTLTYACYNLMFGGCTSLTTAPELPATTLANGCYASMFARCINLTTAPVLSATTLAESCYQNMFAYCRSLTTAPALPATTLANYCYYSMFASCFSLTTAPVLSATTLAIYCYSQMFKDCTSLTTAPALPAMTLDEGCYQEMFEDCTGLTTAPSLPATTLAISCYRRMFGSCSSLTTAPVLSATTLVESCYRQMFNACGSLNYVKCLATDVSASYCTTAWLYSTASSGTFVKASSMTGWSSGTSGIPDNWTIQNA